MYENEEFDESNPFKNNIFTRFAENYPKGETFYKNLHRPTENFGFYKGRDFDKEYESYRKQNNYGYNKNNNSKQTTEFGEYKPYATQYAQYVNNDYTNNASNTKTNK